MLSYILVLSPNRGKSKDLISFLWKMFDRDVDHSSYRRWIQNILRSDVNILLFYMPLFVPLYNCICVFLWFEFICEIVSPFQFGNYCLFHCRIERKVHISQSHNRIIVRVSWPFWRVALPDKSIHIMKMLIIKINMISNHIQSSSSLGWYTAHPKLGILVNITSQISLSLSSILSFFIDSRYLYVLNLYSFNIFLRKPII